jgi:hypothetical protein
MSLFSSSSSHSPSVKPLIKTILPFQNGEKMSDPVPLSIATKGTRYPEMTFGLALLDIKNLCSEQIQWLFHGHIVWCHHTISYCLQYYLEPTRQMNLPFIPCVASSFHYKLYNTTTFTLRCVS